MNIAKKVATLSGWRGEAHVYELDPPVEYDDYEDGACSTKYVIVSAADVPFSGPETYIFPAVKKDDVFGAENMCEMEGSYRGGLDHAEALKGLGYAIED